MLDPISVNDKLYKLFVIKKPKKKMPANNAKKQLSYVCANSSCKCGKKDTK